MSIKSRLARIAVKKAEELAVKKGAKKAAPLAVKKTATLNIGMDVPAGGRLTKAAVTKALKNTGRKPTKVAVVTSDTEPTFVADIQPPLSPKEAHALSKALGQEAIVQYDGAKGALHGPEAKKWGDFSPEYFFLQDGSRLSDAAKPSRVPATVMEHRKTELPKLERQTLEVRPRKTQPVEDLSIYDLEGKPFVTSMSDLSAAGDEITGVNDVTLSSPVRRMGGQDYMFGAPNSVWAADLGPAGAIMGEARRLRALHGQDPVYLPWTMGTRAVDFSHMPRELMLRYAADTLGKRDLNRLNKDVRGIVPDFKAADDPASLEMFREATGSQRSALNRLLDQYRLRGGLGMGEARAAISDPAQVGAPLTSLRNVGTISTRSALEPSTHPSYRTSIPGEGIGRLRETVGALELVPELMARGSDDPFDIPIQPSEIAVRGAPLRALQMRPRSGVITEKLLREIERRSAEKPRKPVRKKARGGRV